MLLDPSDSRRALALHHNDAYATLRRLRTRNADALHPAIPPIQYRLAVRGYPDHHQDISTLIDERDLIRGCDLVKAVRSQEVARDEK